MHNIYKVFFKFLLANRKSGNNDGQEILSLFRRLLNPAQVVDLAERDPVAALEWCRLLGNTPCNILVAGGDGTIAWLLNSIHKLRLEVNFAYSEINFYILIREGIRSPPSFCQMFIF